MASPSPAKTPFVILITETFHKDLRLVPRRVFNAYQEALGTVLKTVPNVQSPPRVKKIRADRELWRVRLGDYRLVYGVDEHRRVVTLLMVGPRAEVYEHRIRKPELHETAALVPDAEGEKFLSESVVPETTESTGPAFAPAESTAPAPVPGPSAPLPKELSAALLSQWQIPAEHHPALLAVRTQDELLALVGSIPDDCLDRILHGVDPAPIEDVLCEPVRQAVEDDQWEAVFDGRIAWLDLLLHLDPEQQAVVDAFARHDTPRGPWLLKGGPGSGKTTIVLQCIERLVRRRAEQPPNQRRPLRILLTTYTHAMKRNCRWLLDRMNQDLSGAVVDIETVDYLVDKHLTAKQRAYNLVPDQKMTALMEQAVNEVTEEQAWLRKAGIPFLQEEIEDYIIGNGWMPTDLDHYLGMDRAGRSRGMLDHHRKAVWKVYRVFRRLLEQQERTTFGLRQSAAARQVRPQYDYVFIDEAQDLLPVGLRFCVGLCRSPEQVFVTADTNQSVFGRHKPWRQICEELQFSGAGALSQEKPSDDAPNLECHPAVCLRDLGC
jgi:mRNA-degrading endonuclease RelE of RelBE toxin-antitoxin system